MTKVPELCEKNVYRGRFIPGEAGLPVAPSSAAQLMDKSRPDLSRSAPANKIADAGAAPSERKTSIARIACVRVADFPIAAIIRANPELHDRPLVLIRMPAAKRPADGDRKAAAYQPHSEVTHVSAAAKAAGVQVGMTVAQARALIAELVVMPPSDAAERAATDALGDVAESISPVVEAGSPGCVWIDLAGLEHVHHSLTHVADSLARLASSPSEADIETAIAEEAARRVHRIGLEAAVGIATSKEVAYLAARCGGLRIIPAGREREFLDWMPLELTDLGSDRIGEELEMRLKRLGLRRLGDLARLDIRAVGSRLGATAVALVRLAQGEGSATLQMRPRSEVFVETVELEYGIENLEALGFVLHAMLNRIGERLHLRGLVAGDMTLALGLVDRSRDDRRVAVAAATGEMRALLMLLNLSLAARSPVAAVETIRLTVEPRHPRPAQNDMFLPPSPAPDRLEAVIARIAALCGPDRVGTLLPAGSYRPEAVRSGDFAPPPAAAPEKINTSRPASHALTRSSLNEDRPLPAGEARVEGIAIARMALRTIRPAEAIEVMCTRATPEFVRGKKIAARVVSFAGPWRRQGEWWAVGSSTSYDSNDSQTMPSPVTHVVRERPLDFGRGSQTHPPPAGPGEAKSQRSETWQSNAPAAYARDYYELALADGGVYRVYRDHHSQKWFLDGVYD